MVTTEQPPVVIDVAVKWAVDAALFLAMGAGFLIWGVSLRSPTGNILSWAIMATVALLLDRMRPFLSDAAGIAKAHEPPPDDAVRRAWRAYAARGLGVTAVLVAFEAALAVALPLGPGFFAGWMTAYGASCLRALAAAHEIERTSGVRLSMTLQRSLWRRRTPAFYATPRLV